MTNDLEKDHLATLAQGLAAATAQRMARWEFAEADVYSWGAPEGKVTVASRDRDGAPPYELIVYNTAGERVDELTSELLADDEPAPWNEELAELYRVARRSALRADDIIDALLERLRGTPLETNEHRSFMWRARAGASAEEAT